MEKPSSPAAQNWQSRLELLEKELQNSPSGSSKWRLLAQKRVLIFLLARYGWAPFVGAPTGAPLVWLKIPATRPLLPSWKRWQLLQHIARVRRESQEKWNSPPNALDDFFQKQAARDSRARLPRYKQK